MKATFDLRPHQIQAIRAFYDAKREGHRSQMFCLPTGAGKTFCAMEIISHLVKFDKRVNFLVDRDVLVKQTSEEFAKNGIRHGVEAGPNTFGRQEPVKVISQQTAVARSLPLNRADLNIVDEGHILFKYVAAKMEAGGNWLGLSASPFRKGLGSLYSNVINVTTTDRLVEEGWLAPLKIFCGKPVHVSKKTSSGEYDIAAAAEATMDIVGNIVEEWEAKTEQHFGGPVKTICFSNSVYDGEKMEAEFRERGHNFRAVSYLTDPEVKAETIEMLRDGHLTGIVSCQMLQRGFDVPDIMCGIDAHPWRRSLSSVVQQAGRAMRSHPGKEYALWLDHAQNCIRHQERLFEFWAHGLDELIPMDNVAGEDQPDREKGVCPECEALLTGSVCLSCGWEKPTPVGGGAPVDGPAVVDGELVSLDPRQLNGHRVAAQVGRTVYDLPPPAQGWEEICALAQEAGKAEDRAHKWAHANFRHLYGHFRKGRYSADKMYPLASNEMRAAIDHRIRLFVAGKKREDRV